MWNQITRWNWQLQHKSPIPFWIPTLLLRYYNNKIRDRANAEKTNTDDIFILFEPPQLCNPPLRSLSTYFHPHPVSPVTPRVPVSFWM